MNVEKLKKRIAKKYLYEHEELSPEEIAQIPKDNKKIEYYYLKERGFYAKNGKYFRKVIKQKSDEDILYFSQLKSMDLLDIIDEEVRDLKIEAQKISNNLNIIKSTLIFIAVMLLIGLFF